MPLECLSAGLLVADYLCAPISHVPHPGELVLTERLELSIGGCAANAAIDLARLGVRVGVLGCVGQDPFGDYVLATLRTQGVDVEGVSRLADAGTASTLIVNVEGQDRRFIHMLGANAAFRVEHIAPEIVCQTRVLYVGGYLLLTGFDPLELRNLFARARAAGVTTVLDVVLPGPGPHWKKFERLLPEVDVFLPNNDEAREITGLTDPVRQAERFLSAGARTVVITCGQEGTVLMSDRLRLRGGVYSMPFVGGTGAGDAFDAGYIAGLLAGEEPRRCLEWGSALGASCVRSVSATASVFNRAEALAYMQTHRLPIAEF